MSHDIRTRAKRSKVVTSWKVILAMAMITTSEAFATSGAQDSDRPAAVIVFPYVATNDAMGDDTVIQITNTHSANGVFLKCFYVSGDGESATTTQFMFYVRAGQPLRWRASAGLPEYPPPDPDLLTLAQFDSSGGRFARMEINAIRTSFVPPVPSAAFVGSLRCVAVDANALPVARNDVIASARVEHYVHEPDSLSVAQYRAIGFQANGSYGDDRQVLVFGGSGAQYDRCARYFSFQHFAQRATLTTSAGPVQVSTKLVLVPCSVDLSYPGASRSTIVIDDYNEFGQLSGTVETVRSQLVKNLSDLGAGGGTRSAFDVSVQGTLTGQSLITVADGSSVIGVALEFYRVLPDGPASATAYTLSTSGGYEFSDRLVFPYAHPPTPLPTETFTPTPEPAVPNPACLGDCNGDQVVDVPDIITMIDFILTSGRSSRCVNGDENADGQLSVDEVVVGINHALNGCE